MMLPILLIVCVNVLSTFACRDVNPSLCRDYTKRFNNCLTENKGLKHFMVHNCMKTCNTCHLSTTTTSTARPSTTPPTPAPMTNCGRTKVQHGRVIAGTGAKAGSWPWQAAIYYAGKFLCGGTLVSPTWVVTAAHCVRRTAARHYEVVLGDLKRNVTESSEQRFKVRQWFYSADYNRPTSKANDIALLRLAKPAILTDYVQRACLPERGDKPAVGTVCMLTGWGKMKHPGPGVNYLQQVDLPVASQKDCAAWNGNMKVTIDPSMLCAGDLKKPKSGCHGDSGGPLVCQKSDGRWFLHGVVSWGSPICRSAHAYSVFARVTHLREWLDRYIWYN